MGKFVYHVLADTEADAKAQAKAIIGQEAVTRTRTKTRTRKATNIRISEAVQDPDTGLWTITGTMTPNITEAANE
jgi:hypothetical protein